MTTITVVANMIRSAWSLDSSIPLRLTRKKIDDDRDRDPRRDRLWFENASKLSRAKVEEIDQPAHDVLARRNAADGPGQHVIEEQCGNRDLGHVPPIASFTTR